MILKMVLKNFRTGKTRVREPVPLGFGALVERHARMVSFNAAWKLAGTNRLADKRFVRQEIETTEEIFKSERPDLQRAIDLCFDAILSRLGTVRGAVFLYRFESLYSRIENFD